MAVTATTREQAIEGWLGAQERRLAAYRAIIGAGRAAGAGDAAQDLGLPFGCTYLLIYAEVKPSDHICGPDCPCWGK